MNVYQQAAGSGGDRTARARFASLAAADLSDFFGRRNWRSFEREYEVTLWGTESVTVTAASGSIVTISGATDDDWVDQDLVIGNGVPYRIVAINTSGTGGRLEIEPDYNGTISESTSATVRQVRVALPDNLGGLLDYVTRDTARSYQTSPAAMLEVLRRGGSVGYCHAVHKDHLLIWPTGTDRLFFRYTYRPDELYEYGVGSALVRATDLTNVIGVSANFLELPNDGEGTVFEEDSSIVRGMPRSHEVQGIIDSTHLRLEEDWTGTIGSSFDYHVSVALELPHFMALWVHAQAEYRAGKMADSDVAKVYLRACAADVPSFETVPRSGEADYGLALVTATR